jgi:uncharacterized protein (TIGR02118 family)
MFAALGNDGPQAIEAAMAAAGTAYVASARGPDPAFTTLVLTEDRDAVARVASIGLYAVTVRRMRHQRRFWPDGEPSPGVTAAFGMLRQESLSHAQSDAHWRDVHAPLALRHHPGMWHYQQVSIDEVVSGRFYDGIALCAFASDQELEERFFGGPEDQAVIRNDVAKFADMTRSPQRVRMTEWRFGPD